MVDRSEDLALIDRALDECARVLSTFTPGKIASETKAGHDPVTEADRVVDDLLRDLLPAEGEGWLSEETADTGDRLGRVRVWVVDPLDGTREFIEGIPEWCVSIGLIESGKAVAGGIHNIAMDHRVLGSVETGVTLNGIPARVRPVQSIERLEVLASRSEVRRGEWDEFRQQGFEVRPVGSVAYKMALVAAGLADATWTLTPKNEWDVAAGSALVLAGGGDVWLPDGSEPVFNRRRTRFPGLVATPPGITAEIKSLMA
jgi:myo-inositol-1(or 4)-monophosphatase